MIIPEEIGLFTNYYLFFEAARLKYRFPTEDKEVSTEELFDMTVDEISKILDTLMSEWELNYSDLPCMEVSNDIQDDRYSLIQRINIVKCVLYWRFSLTRPDLIGV